MSRGAETGPREPRPPRSWLRAGFRLLTIAGSGLVIYTAVYGISGRFKAESMWRGNDSFLHIALFGALEVNIPVFFLLTAAYYALICAVRGDGPLCHRWLQNLLAAVVLVLVSMALSLAYFVVYPEPNWANGEYPKRR